MADVLIIGGGVCGLMAARVLASAGIRVQVVDKGNGLGGRLASRRLRSGEFVGVVDFGAQYFRATQPAFQSWVENWQQAGVVKPWEDITPGKPAYRGEPSLRALATHLAQGLNVITAERITHITWQENQWIATAENGSFYTGDRLVLTPPMPQTLALLQTANIKLSPEIQRDLDQITYDPCLSLSLLLSEPSLIPAPGGLRLENSPLAWLACNYQKGISPQGYSVTIQAGPGFSRDYFDQETDQVTQLMITEATPWFGSDILATHLHRWRYSQPINPYPAPFLKHSQPGPLYLGGDSFGPGKIEGAALSGLAIAEDILQELT